MICLKCGLFSLGASILLILVPCQASFDEANQQRVAAEIPGWEDNNYRIEEKVQAAWDEYMWQGGHHVPKHPQHKPLHHPSHDHHAWADEPPKDYHPLHEEPSAWDPKPWQEIDPWNDEPDPWYDEPNAWEEPCIPVHATKVRKRPRDSDYSGPYHKGLWNKEDWKDLESEGHEWEKMKWTAYSRWHQYENGSKKKYKNSKSKSSKAMKGMKSKNGRKRHKPKHQPPKPCPMKETTKESSKTPTNEPTMGDSGSRNVPAPTPNQKTQETSGSDEISIELTPFTIQFRVQTLKHPSKEDIEDVVNTTMDLLQDYFFNLFTPKAGVIINFFTVSSPEDKDPRVQNGLIAVDFRATAFFDAHNSDGFPSVTELDTLLKHAFWGESLDEYHKELKDLPQSCVFSSAVVFSVSFDTEVDSNVEDPEGVLTRPQDSTQQDDPPDTDAAETQPDTDPVTHDDPPPPNDIALPPPKDETLSVSEPQDVGKDSSSFTPPAMVVTIVSSTIIVMGAVLIYLYREKLKKEKQVRQFPLPKNDGHSVAEATMMADEDSVIACEIGDDDFRATSHSTRRSRAGNFLRLIIEENDDKNNGRRRFLVANAFRGGNMWSQ